VAVRDQNRVEQRKQLLSMIRISQRTMESGQRDDFLSKRRLPRSLRERYELYFDFLDRYVARNG
jgi:hypothetical protein